ncbi:MAG: hypothetical protein JW801_17490 [Bacteroidales bacterium]|nr:hypothetical protein [Bacteroidales bacterium]
MYQVFKIFRSKKAAGIRKLFRLSGWPTYFLSTIFLFTGLLGFSQADHLDSLLNDLVYNDSDPLIIPGEPAKYHFFYAGTAVNSKTMYAGREIGEDMINISGHIYYYTSSGLFIGLSGRWFSQLSPGYNNTTLSVGYGKAIGKKKEFNLRGSYSRFIYADPLLAELYPDKNSLSLGLSYRKKWFGSRLSGSFLFGEGLASNLSMAVYSRFTLVKLKRNNKVYTSPELSLFLGTETVTTGQTGSMASGSYTGTKEVFGLLNTQVNVPLAISLGDFDIELSCTLNIPTTQDVSIAYPVSMYYGISVGYMLPIEAGR